MLLCDVSVRCLWSWWFNGAHTATAIDGLKKVQSAVFEQISYNGKGVCREKWSAGYFSDCVIYVFTWLMISRMYFSLLTTSSWCLCKVLVDCRVWRLLEIMNFIWMKIHLPLVFPFFQGSEICCIIMISYFDVFQAIIRKQSNIWRCTIWHVVNMCQKL